VALVTGARQGIGAEVATCLAAAGARVAIAARRQADVGAAVSAIQAGGGEALALGFDVQDTSAIAEAITAVADHFGRLDILVNNAGVTLRSNAFNYSQADWDEVLNTNLRSAFFASREAARHMIKSGGGRIINVSSMYARVAHPERAAYIASKAGLEGLTRALAAEWGPDGIAVNGVAPGTIRTPSRADIQHDSAFMAGRISRIPLGRIGEVSDIALAVLYLVGPSGGYITGQTLLVDGGFSVV
ncbi:MAG: SDR family NAD(P)-dependent oxidoreductase, partial [Candidatus Dormibacteraceae bacterium]